MISVVMPAFNAERWIEHSVGSAANQTFADLEVIVVDDGSADDTAISAESLADPRVRVIRQQNLGAAAARNRGLREARGDLIQFLDADDVLSPDKLEKQVAALASAPPGSVASCAWGRFSGDAATAEFREEPVWTVADPVEWLVVSLAGGGMMQPAAWLTPRSIIDAAGPWDERLTLHDDGEFFTRVLLKSSRNVFVNDAKVYYRDVEDSLSRRRGRAAIESALAVCHARATHLLALRDDNAVRRALATQYAQFAYEHSSDAADLASDALGAIENLGVEPHARVGGPLFAFLGQVTGFRAAMRLRQDLRGGK